MCHPEQSEGSSTQRIGTEKLEMIGFVRARVDAYDLR
jgi:hypothetical protein